MDSRVEINEGVRNLMRRQLVLLRHNNGVGVGVGVGVDCNGGALTSASIAKEAHSDPLTCCLSSRFNLRQSSLVVGHLLNLLSAVI